MALIANLIKGILVFILILNNFTNENILPRMIYETGKLPIQQINLDLPVKERYRNLLIENKDKIKVYAYFVSLSSLSGIVSKWGSLLINKKTQDPEWYEYIEAVSEYAEISISQAIMLSVTYEMACTTTIVQDKNDNIFMGRNLDFYNYFVIAHLMFETENFRGNKLIYRGIELLGYRGVINAIKPGRYATSLNLRHGTLKLSNLYRIFQGLPTPNFYLMKVMEKADSYEEASDMLSTRHISAPVFYIVSGLNKNEGVVISRNHDSIYDLNRLDVDNGKWSIAICNVDFDKEEYEDDYRRKPAEDNLKRIGRDNINYDNMFSDVLTVYPNNNFLTVYSTVQSPRNEGYFNTTLYKP